MNHQRTQVSRSLKLPAMLRPLFWDYDFGALGWDSDRFGRREDVLRARSDQEARTSSTMAFTWVEKCQDMIYIPIFLNF